MSTPTCKHCHAPIPLPISGYVRRRGFCSAKCNVAYVPQLLTRLCANVSCKRGEGGTRKVFTTYKSNAECCSKPCQLLKYQRERGWRRTSAAREAYLVEREVAAPEPTYADVDLPAEVIDAQLARLAQRRKQTRSWLRITDPWAQRPGSELHKQNVGTYDLSEGEMP